MVFVVFQKRNDKKWDSEKNAFVNAPPELVDLVGSDGYFILDGRTKLETMKIDCIERMHKLRKVQSDICGYEIRKGKISQSTLLYKWERSGWNAPRLNWR